jgi:hypothetical protein
MGPGCAGAGRARLKHRRACGCELSGSPRCRVRGTAASEVVRSEAGLKAHVCLPGSASPPACRGSASPPACRGRRLDGADRRPLAPRLPDRPLVATEPARRAHACQVAPLVRSKTRHLPATTRLKPDRLDNPNRPVSVLSNSEPALCALAPAPSYQAAPVPVPSPGFTHSCARVQVAAATPKPGRQARRLAVFPGRNHRNGAPPPPDGFRHYLLLPGCAPDHRFNSRCVCVRDRPERGAWCRETKTNWAEGTPDRAPP